MAYLIDADVLISAKNTHYGFDFCPAFWDWLVREHAAGVVFSIEKVGDELAGAGDELSTWADARGPTFFRSPSGADLPSLAKVAAWASTQGYQPAAVNEFLRAADYYLIAQALTSNDIVVTNEVASGSKKKIKIPDACIALGIKCMQPFAMLRRQHARFVL